VRFGALHAKYAALAPVFTERWRRLWAASEARTLGHGGIGLVERATGISRATIHLGFANSRRTRPCRRDETARPGPVAAS